MLEGAGFPPLIQGGIVVGGILVLSVFLYGGYALLERFLVNRLQPIIDDE